ncbi:MAG: hypothetical protein CMK09_04155 [Ponticaulis sp.]|nr:hypothetical protein [Ponticaulis sp.]|tara:strand:- start:21802 stop:23646 length:1845 start_codon:yes stop_codon:yes gene_type:complete
MDFEQAGKERVYQIVKLVVTCVLVVVTVVCGYKGWREYNIDHLESMYRTIGAFEFDEIYLTEPEDDTRLSWFGEANKDNRPDVNIWLQIARLTGVGTLFAAVILTLSGFLSENWKRFWIKLRKKDILILGSGPFTKDAMALIANSPDKKLKNVKRRHKVLHLGASSFSCSQSSFFLGKYRATLPWADPDLPEITLRTHARSGRHVLVSEEEDSETIELATKLRDMRKKHDTSSSWSRTLTITAILRDARLAEDANLNWSDDVLSFVDSSSLAVRRLHRQHPPFRQAKGFGHDRINALIVGFGDMGKAVAGDLAMNCAVDGFQKQKITVVDPHVNARTEALKLRSPEYNELFELERLPGAFGWGDIPPPSSTNVPEKVSAVYVCLSDDTSALAALSDVRIWLQRSGHIQVPIFVHLRHAALLKKFDDKQPDENAAPLYVFGDRTSILEESGFLNPDADKEARRIHAAYCAGVPEAERWKRGETVTKNNESTVSWFDLKPKYKASTRAVVDHIHAKLFSLDKLSGDMVEKCPDFSKNPIVLDEADMDNQARLEHDRFIAERRWAGWRAAETKNADLLLHNCFIPYDQLDEKTQGYDKEIVERVMKVLNGEYPKPSD